MTTIETHPVQSSNIREMGYDPYNLRARVIFIHGGTYDVLGMSAEQYEAWESAPSVGKHFAAHVKGHFQIEKVG